MYSTKKYKTDVVIICLIIFLPFLFYTYLFFPVVEETEILGYHIKFYDFFQYQMWALYTKVFTLFIFIAWYFTCEHWWRPFILILTILELFRFVSVFNDNLHWDTSFTFLDSLPFSLPIVLLVIWLSKKMGYYRSHDSLSSQVDKEINDHTIEALSRFQKENYVLAKKLYEELQEEKKNLDDKSYLKKLVQIRETYLKN